MSEVRGVGSSCTTFGKASSNPFPRESRGKGVGSRGEEDEPAPLMGSADLVRAYNTPLNIEPEVGKVDEDRVESESKVIRDVLKDRDSGSKNPKGTGNVRPEVPLIIGSFQFAGEGKRLAGVAAALCDILDVGVADLIEITNVNEQVRKVAGETGPVPPPAVRRSTIRRPEGL